MKNRQRIVDQLQKYMLEKLEENQHKGDDWKKDSWEELRNRLDEEIGELLDGLFYLEQGHDSLLENTLRECGDVANIVAMILDKLLDRKKESQAGQED